MKLPLHGLFYFSFFTAFWQYVEFSCRLSELGEIPSPLWSGILGFPVLHHAYWGFLGVFFIYLYLSWSDYFRLYCYVYDKIVHRTG